VDRRIQEVEAGRAFMTFLWVAVALVLDCLVSEDSAD